MTTLKSMIIERGKAELVKSTDFSLFLELHEFNFAEINLKSDFSVGFGCLDNQEWIATELKKVKNEIKMMMVLLELGYATVASIIRNSEHFDDALKNLLSKGISKEISLLILNSTKSKLESISEHSLERMNLYASFLQNVLKTVK